jgi:hypothetical protein
MGQKKVSIISEVSLFLGLQELFLEKEKGVLREGFHCIGKQKRIKECVISAKFACI